MENLPLYVYITFVLTVAGSVWLFYKASGYSKSFLMIVAGWICIQSLLGYIGFYTKPDTTPPRFVLLVLPPFVLLITSLLTSKGKHFLDRLNIKTLTIFQVVRIPVEIVLYWLFLNKSVPALMTFEGRNFDIVSGLTAPFIWYFGFVKNSLNKTLVLIWNLICFALMLNAVITGFLSAPTKFQHFAFDQPNIAVNYFPFLLLPACLVPLVAFAHVASIRKLLTRTATITNIHQ